ncbi:MAG: hypothetical protein M3209_17930 [Acidobacteriota bacterium]|nr:hypothetical protein [Acidobacteriota bacterium]
MKKIILFSLLFAFGAMNANTLAQKTSKSDTPVTSTISNAAPVNFEPLSIQNDGQGSYKTNSSTYVTSIIQGIGDWELELLSPSPRRVYYNFDYPVAGTNPDPINRRPPSNGWYNTRFITQCSTKLTSLTTIGSSTTCPLIINVDDTPSDDSTNYSLRFYSANYPGTNNVTWVCTAAANSKCTGWRAQSDTTGNGGKLVAQLLKIRRAGNKTYTDDYGKYNISYDISLTNP